MLAKRKEENAMFCKENFQKLRTPARRKAERCRASWCTLVILALRRLKQEDLECKTSMGYIVRLGPPKEHCCLNYQIPQQKQSGIIAGCGGSCM
jgi:hypothetical protein